MLGAAAAILRASQEHGFADALRAELDPNSFTLRPHFRILWVRSLQADHQQEDLLSRTHSCPHCKPLVTSLSAM